MGAVLADGISNTASTVVGVISLSQVTANSDGTRDLIYQARD